MQIVIKSKNRVCFALKLYLIKVKISPIGTRKYYKDQVLPIRPFKAIGKGKYYRNSITHIFEISQIKTKVNVIFKFQSFTFVSKKS